MPVGQLVLVVLAALIFLGLAQRVLDRMRLTDTTALLLLAALFVAPFVPNLPVAAGITLDIAGALVPLGIAVYLVATADRAYERTRAVLAAVVTAAAVFAVEQLLPPEPTGELAADIDPLWATGLVAGAVGYLSGRSRRASFVAGVGGVALTDVIYGAVSAARGATGGFAAIGGAGAFDAVIIAGVVAVLLAEVVGETREYFARRVKNAGGDARGEAAPDQPPPGGTTGLTLVSLAIAAGLVLGGAAGNARLYGPARPAHQVGASYRMVDERGSFVTESGLPFSVGDRWIDASNDLYQVFRVEGRTAVARSLGRVELDGRPRAVAAPAVAGDAGSRERSVLRGAGLIDYVSRIVGVGDQGGGRDLLILHSHNAESYEPSDGRALENGRGTIHRVGARLADELRQRGFQVEHDQSLHLPHDRGAYRRSRRTIMEHLPQQVAAVLDIHRDATPDPEAYAYETDGGEQGVTKIRLVVGRQNPNRAQNLEFAKELKAIADEKYPGLVRGIFHAKNNYNQDLGPRVLLFEVGTHTNARPSAVRAMPLLADIIEEFFARRGE